jgi:hypothetical protein
VPRSQPVIDAAAALHADYYRTIASAAFRGLRGPCQHDMITQLDLDSDNIAAALDWLLAHGRRTEVADMCWSLWLYYWLRNSVTEGRRWTCGALGPDGQLPQLQRGRLLASDAFLAAWRRNYPLAQDELTEAQAIAETEGDDDLQLLARIMLIIVYGGLGDESRARQTAAEALRLARTHEDRWAEAVALTGVCWLNAAVGRFDGEDATFAAMVEAAAEAEDPLWIALADDNLAELDVWNGRYSVAASHIVSSLRVLATLRMAYAGVGTLHTAAWLLSRLGDWAAAVRVQSSADGIMDDMNAGLWPLWASRHDQLIDDAREHLGVKEFESCAAAGRQWEFDLAAAASIALLAPLVDGATPASIDVEPRVTSG